MSLQVYPILYGSPMSGVTNNPYAEKPMRPTPELTLATPTKTITVTMKHDGWYSEVLSDGTTLDFYRFGRKYGVAMGDVDKPPYEVACSFVMSARDVANGTELFGETAFTIEYGQMLDFGLGKAELRIDQRDAPLIGVYIGNGPPSEQLPLHDLKRFSSLGPNPDPEDADSTGSGRVFSQRCPMVMSYLLRHTYLNEGPTDEQRAEVDRWTSAQALRGYCMYRSSLNYALWSAWEDADKHIVGQGYRKAGGGFADGLYSKTLPPGVTWPKSGLATGSSAHMTLEALVTSAIFFKDWTAARCAIHLFEAISSFLLAGEKWSSRCYGWFFDSAALMAPLAAYYPSECEWIREAVAYALGRLKAANKNGMPAPDNGKTSEGGHLSYDELYPVLSLLGWTEEQIRDGARSDSSWIVAILVSGLDSLIRTWDAYKFWQAQGSSSSRALAVEQLKIASAFIVDACGSAKIDIKKGLVAESIRRPASLVWDDVGALYGFAEGGDGTNTMGGVYIRFLVPALYIIADRFPDYESAALALTVPTLSHCDSNRWWNTDDFTRYMLEAGWPVGKVRGWWFSAT